MGSRGRWTARWLAIGLWLVGVLAAPLAAAGAQADLGLAASKMVDSALLKPTDEINLDVKPGETGAATEFVLRQTERKEPLSVQLRALVGGKTIDFAADGESAGHAVVVPAAGGVVFVAASVDGVVDAVDATGELVAVADGQPQVLATMHLKKTAPDPLALSGAKDGAFLAVATTNAFTQELTIESTTAAAIPVVVTVSPLQHADAGSATTTVAVDGGPYDQRTPITVPAQGTAKFTVSATLPRSGDWKGTISLVYGTTRATTNLEVNRRRLAPSITIDEITPVHDTLAFLGLGKPEPHEVRMLVHIQETEGQDLELELPSVLPLVRESGANKFQTTDHEKVRFEVGGKAVETITVPADGEVDVTVIFTDLTTPGTYTGAVKFAAPGPTSTEKAYSIFVRRSIWTAALIIFLAVALSAAIRWFLVSRRGRLKARARVTQLANHVNDVYEATGHSASRYELARHVRTRLDVLARRLASGPVPDADIDQEAHRVELLSGYLGVASRAEKSSDPAAHDAELAAVSAISRKPVPSADDWTTGDAKLAAIDDALSHTDTLPEVIAALRTDIDRASQKAAGDTRAKLDAWIKMLDQEAGRAAASPKEAAKGYEGVPPSVVRLVVRRPERTGSRSTRRHSASTKARGKRCAPRTGWWPQRSRRDRRRPIRPRSSRPTRMRRVLW
nr:Unknown Function [uncultured bacterium]